MTSISQSQIIVWSANWQEITGQAIVTRRVVEHQSEITWFKASYGSSGAQSIIGLIRAVTLTYYALLSGKARTIYLVCSRSGAGFLRDLPALFASVLGIRVIVHVHGSDIVHLLTSSPFSSIARMLYNRCEIIVPSKHLIAPLRKVCSGKLRLCENFVTESSKDGYIIGNRNEAHLVVWNSNIMASKGFFEVVAAIRIARKKLPYLKLVALGRPLRDAEMTEGEVQRALAELRRDEWFTYVGPVSPEMAFQWTALADIVVFPSRNECQPLAVIQAMCLGRPLVLRDTPAIRATIGNYPAIFLNNPSSGMIADAITQTLKTDRRVDLEKAANLSRERFSQRRFDCEMAAILKGC